MSDEEIIVEVLSAAVDVEVVTADVTVEVVSGPEVTVEVSGPPGPPGPPGVPGPPGDPADTSTLVKKSGDTMTGPLAMVDGSQVKSSSGAATLAVDGTTYTGTYYKIGGVIRFFLGADNVVWKLAPFTDAGSEDSSKAMLFYRASGDVVVGGRISAPSVATALIATPGGILDVAYARIIAVGDPQGNLDAVNKQYTDARTPKISVGTTAPSSPAVGDVWIDTN